MSQRTELIREATILAASLSANLQNAQPPRYLTRDLAANFSWHGRKLNAVLNELENVVRGCPEPRQRRD